MALGSAEESLPGSDPQAKAINNRQVKSTRAAGLGEGGEKKKIKHKCRQRERERKGRSSSSPVSRRAWGRDVTQRPNQESDGAFSSFVVVSRGRFRGEEGNSKGKLKFYF